jgi:ABC-type uncharacterized transport system involved in gliding motility auxiliary subunit
MPAKTQSFERARRIFAFHRWARIVLCITLVLGLNYLGMTFYVRKDITFNNIYSITPETRDYIGKLDKDITVYVIYGKEDNSEFHHFQEDVRNLLKEYEYHASRATKGKFQVKYVDIFQQRQEAEELARKFHITQPHLVIFASGDRSRIIRPNELYETKGGLRSAFLGEQVFTTALLQVTSDHSPKIYFLSGHGEMSPDDVSPLRGVSEFATALLQRNYEVWTLNLNESQEIPPDADLVIALAPQVPYNRASQQKLRRYLQPVSPRILENGEILESKPGKLMLALNPGHAHGLEDFLLDWGILADDVIMIDLDPTSQTPSGDLMISRYADHPITSILINNNIAVRLGLSRSIREDLGRDLSQPIVQTPLLFSSDNAWGESAYQSNPPFEFNKAVDLEGPLPVAMLAERSLQQFGIRLGPKLAIFGSGDFLSNQQLGFLGNFPLALNTVRWLLDEEPQVQALPRPIYRTLILLTSSQMSNLRLLMSIAIPGIFVCIAILVYFLRRR